MNKVYSVITFDSQLKTALNTKPLNFLEYLLDCKSNKILHEVLVTHKYRLKSICSVTHNSQS